MNRYLFICSLTQTSKSANHMAVIHTPKQGEGSWLKFRKESYLSDFEHGMVFGARWAGVCISETADQMGFSHINVSWVFTEKSEKMKTSSVIQWALSSSPLLIVEVREELPGWLKLKPTVTQITSYNQSMQKGICECTTHCLWNRGVTTPQEHTGCHW